MEAEGLEALEKVAIAALDRLAHLAPGIGEEAQAPLLGERGIELPQPARGGIARVDEEGLAFGFAFLVERVEVLARHINLAAHLDDLGNAAPFERVRHVLDHLEIGGDVLAHLAITPRRALHQHAALIAERGGQAVDLGLAHQGDPLVLGQAEKAPDTAEKIPQLVVIEGVVEGQHRAPMSHLGEAGRGRCAHAARWAVFPHQRRKASLDRAVALAQQVIRGV